MTTWTLESTTVKLTTMECPTCGVLYAMPERMRAAAWQKGHGEIQWYCTNGHRLGYQGKSEAEKEKERRIRAEALAARRQDQLEMAERSRSALKGQITKAKRRTGHGVCPVPSCKRQFPDLAAHMASKHPDEVVDLVPARSPLAPDSHACADCSSRFTTARGLAVHRGHMHRGEA